MFDALNLLLEKHPDLEIVNGGAPGADELSNTWAKANEVTHIVCPAKWNRHGRAGGPIRNRYMLRRFMPDLVLAFHYNIDKSKGTKDMIEISEKSGIKVKRFFKPKK